MLLRLLLLALVAAAARAAAPAPRPNIVFLFAGAKQSAGGVDGSEARQSSASRLRRATTAGFSAATSRASARSSGNRCSDTRPASAVRSSFQPPSRTASRGHQSGSVWLPRHSQKTGRVRATGWPSSAGRRFSPSPR